MIPHHAIAIETCEHADIDKPEMIELCDSIVQTQREEIVQVRDIFERLDERWPSMGVDAATPR